MFKMLAVLSEKEQDSTKVGLSSARARGCIGGRPRMSLE